MFDLVNSTTERDIKLSKLIYFGRHKVTHYMTT